jgi:hypothetical protein
VFPLPAGEGQGEGEYLFSKDVSLFKMRSLTTRRFNTGKLSFLPS